MLSANKETADNLLAQPADGYTSLLVVAEIDKVVPLTLKLESCREADCSEVSLESNVLDTSRRISGRASAIEVER